jgi:hypothetical protein
MDSQTVNQTTEIIPLLGYELKKTGGYSVGACPKCGGTDRFTIKHTREGDRWHCRQCGDGKYHTAIDFVMWLYGVDFKSALYMLGGKPQGKVTQPTAPKPQPKPIELPPADWQAQAWRIVDKACDALLSGAGQGSDYLAGRGLTVSTWEANHLGFTHAFDAKSKRTRPAVVIPWITRADVEIIAVKYRFIDNDPGGLRYTSLTGSVPLLFGAWAVMDTDKTLFFVEGEINALSIWQCQIPGVSVLSFGSEANGRADILRNASSHYDRVVIWCDDPQRAKQYQNLLGRRCIKIQSPKINDSKQDANQLLQAGKLNDVLQMVLA